MAGQLNYPVPPGGTIIADAAQSGTINSKELYNPAAKGVRLHVISPAAAGAGSVIVKVQTKDPITGSFVDLPSVATASISGNSQAVALIVYPGISGADVTNVKINQHLGTSWRVVATVTGTYEFSVSGDYLA